MPSRRTHRKSRNGCAECKRRRVKCNEQNPCQNCLKYDSNCVYDACFAQRTTPAVSTRRRPSPTPRPSSMFPEIDEITQSTRTSTSGVLNSTWTLDLELMHHFTTVVCKTLSNRKELQEVWGIILPQVAFSCDYLIHGILAFSALHLAVLKSENKGIYIDCSGSHLHRSLSTYGRVLPNITAHNCITLFALSSLVAVHVCALPIADGSGPSVEKVTALFSMCRGVETILVPYLSLIRESPLKPLFHDDYRLDVELLSSPSREKTLLPEDLRDRLSRLKELIANYITELEERTTYLGALTHLEISFSFIEQASIPLECGMAFVWPIMLQREFVGFLREYKPLSLVLLSYYCIILNCLNSFWFLRGWDKALLSEIWNCMPLELRPWIAWPKIVCDLK